jgi:hypothetical protein
LPIRDLATFKVGGLTIMKYALYEDPLTHRFALLALPYHFIDGDPLPIAHVDQWFGSREEAIGALSDLLNREELGSAVP